MHVLQHLLACSGLDRPKADVSPELHAVKIYALRHFVGFLLGLTDRVSQHSDSQHTSTTGQALTVLFMGTRMKHHRL